MQSCDSDSDIEEEFFAALALFKSDDKYSVGKLRKMLLTAIAKRKNISNLEEITFPSVTYESVNNDTMYSKENFVKIYDIPTNENSMDVIEIPRISIPDEECTDLTTCKICGEAKIGPFILLECQDCQDAYHPLCHQPSVTDIDVYDPRLVWRCSKCHDTLPDNAALHNTIGTSSLSDIIVTKEEQFAKANHSVTSRNYSKKIRIYSAYDNQEELHNAPKDLMKEEHVMENKNQLKKRIGSKLNVSRGK